VKSKGVIMDMEFLGIEAKSGSATLICLGVACGKTTLLLNISIEAWKQGKKVLFISEENSIMTLKGKVLCNLTDTGYYDALSLSGMQLDYLVQEFKNSKGELQFFRFEDRIENKISQMKEYINNYKPDLVLIDGLHSCRDSFINRNHSSFDFALICSSQAFRNISSQTFYQLYLNEFEHFADFIYCQNHKENGKLDLICKKHRYDTFGTKTNRKISYLVDGSKSKVNKV
jgi:hypothetical protein